MDVIIIVWMAQLMEDFLLLEYFKREVLRFFYEGVLLSPHPFKTSFYALDNVCNMWCTAALIGHTCTSSAHQHKSSVSSLLHCQILSVPTCSAESRRNPSMDTVAAENEKQMSCRKTLDGDLDTDKCTSITASQTVPTGSVVSSEMTSAPVKVTPASQDHQPISCAATVSGPQTSSSSLMVIHKVVPSIGLVSTSGPPEGTKPLSERTSLNPTAGRTLVITVPAAAPAQLVAAVPRQPQAASTKLSTNISIPPGMMLIRSDSGQLMLVSQQALAQAQQVPRSTSNQTSRVLAPQVIGAASKPAAVQTLVKQPGPTGTKTEPRATFSQEMMDNVKKCKNFLVTLIKLASTNSKSANLGDNVRGLVLNMQEGKVEAEAFTEHLYRELKSTPQPCLVPFLKKSLPAVRHLTTDAQLFIQQASAPRQSSSMNSCETTVCTRQNEGTFLKHGLMTLAQSQFLVSKSSTPTPNHHTGSFGMKQPVVFDQPSLIKYPFKDGSGSYKDNDDINDVASMAGVNLREENARIFTTLVGSVVHSCHDQPFLSTNLLLSRILCTGEVVGVNDVGPEVVALVSHAAQEFLRGLLERLLVLAEHRKHMLKEDLQHNKVSDVRSQLRFLEEVESLKKRKIDEEEREKLLCLARSRSNTEDPEHQLLKQRAKELQQTEEAQLQQRQANIAALAAIGPRKKRAPEESQACVLPRPGVHRVTRVMLTDLLFCMEHDHFLHHSLTLYKAMVG
ncbi:transcription initiation factor TFIID subunit 4-like [Thalassophryne amazonica]|uniref:transcription initiation factor TFIID subunit 4-like n=1 Tax=Thalassophryne amazonica TaxID=390379 RepID=UPI001471C80F|nr:transcription initiation factor TFIID subunit 4-like [Thalassophryne amazonica]